MPPRRPFRAGAAALAALLSVAAARAEAPPRAPLPSPRPGAAAAAEPVDTVAVGARAVPAGFPLGDAPRLELSGAIEVTADHPLWGGLSGLVVSEDGARFWAVSDRGALFAGRFRRAGTALAGVEGVSAIPLRDPQGAPLTAGQHDPEGLARSPEGALWVSFEGERPRIWRYPRPGAPAETVPPAPEFARLQLNSGLEALARDAGGALYAIPERSGALDRPFPVFRRAAGADRWSVGSLPRAEDFLVTGADVGPDGALYVVERAFGWLGGFSVRLRRAPLDRGAALAPETLLVRRGGVDNVESVAAWRGRDGRLRLILATDDNFNALQRTVFVELVLD